MLHGFDHQTKIAHFGLIFFLQQEHQMIIIEKQFIFSQIRYTPSFLISKAQGIKTLSIRDVFIISHQIQNTKALLFYR